VRHDGLIAPPILLDADLDLSHVSDKQEIQPFTAILLLVFL